MLCRLLRIALDDRSGPQFLNVWWVTLLCNGTRTEQTVSPTRAMRNHGGGLKVMTQGFVGRWERHNPGGT